MRFGRITSWLAAVPLSVLTACAATQAPAQAVAGAPGQQSPKPESAELAQTGSDLDAQLLMSLHAPLPRQPAQAPVLQKSTHRGKRQACLADVHVTTGGIVLTYAGSGAEVAVDNEVRHMATLHNRSHVGSHLADDPSTVRSIALVDDQGRGTRIVLLADDSLDLADLYSHLESDAPALIPRGSLERGWCQQNAGNSAASLK